MIKKSFLVVQPFGRTHQGTDAPACEAFSGLGRRDCEHWFFYTHANALVACELTAEGECKAAEPVFCRVRDPHVTVVREHAR